MIIVDKKLSRCLLWIRNFPDDYCGYEINIRNYPGDYCGYEIMQMIIVDKKLSS